MNTGEVFLVRAEWPLLTAPRRCSVRLISQLCTDTLLDRGHYLDWLIHSAAECSLEKLAIWLLYLEVHLRIIVEKSKWGKRLTELLLRHLHNAHELPNRESYHWIILELVKILQPIFVSAPSCFLNHKTWTQYENIIANYLIHDKHAIRATFKDLLRRNLRLQERLSHDGRPSQPTHKQIMLSLFDSLDETLEFTGAACRCLRLNIEHGVVVGTCLRWCASLDRRGLYRIFAAARLMRLWSRLQVDVQGHILNFLGTHPDAKGLHKPAIYQLVAELTCSSHFSVGRYLQWLMARDILDKHQALYREGRCDTRLLLELPLYGLDDEVLNLRRRLLCRYERPFPGEDEEIEMTKATITKRLPDLLLQNHSYINVSLATDFESLSQSTRNTAARWLHEAIISLGVDSSSNDFIPGNPRTQTATDISPVQLQSVLSIFEDLGEFTMLAKLMSGILRKIHSATLVILSDTINYHCDIFTSIGASQHLFRCLYDRFCDLQDISDSDKPFLDSLIDLGVRFADLESKTRNLRKKSLTISANRTTIACSPISDTMIEAVSPIGFGFVDELDQMLAGGTSMDRQTVLRFFGAITHCLNQTWTGKGSVSQLTGLLAKLQAFDPIYFEPLVAEWVKGLLLSDRMLPLAEILPPLFCSRITSLDRILSWVITALTKLPVALRASLALEVLNLMADVDVRPAGDREHRMYRLHDQQKMTLRACPLSVIKIYQFAYDADGLTDLKAPYQMQTRPDKSRIVSLLNAALLQALAKSSKSIPLDDSATESIGKCYLSWDRDGDGFIDDTQQFAMFLNDVNEFNILFYQLRLLAAFKTRKADATTAADNFAHVLIKATLKGPPNRTALWARLISILPQEIAKVVREHAENMVIFGMCGQTSNQESEARNTNSGLLALIDATASDFTTSEPSPAVNGILRALSNPSQLPQQADDISYRDFALQHTETTLRLLMIYQSIFQQPQAARDILPHILVALSIQIMKPAPSYTSATYQDVLDVLSLLCDYLSEEGHNGCSWVLYNYSKAKCHRLRFFFGFPEIVGSGCFHTTSQLRVSESSEGGGPKESTALGKPYYFRNWEMMPDTTPAVAENDTSLNLVFFGAKKSVL